MPAATKAKPKLKAKAKTKPLSREQLLERDPWHFHRIEDPVFAAIVKVLRDRTPVYDMQDWGPWLFGKPDCPKEAKLLKAGRMILDPDPICGSKAHLYNEAVPRPRGHKGWHYSRGGGYIERFAQGVISCLNGAIVTHPGDGWSRPVDGYRYDWSLNSWEKRGYKRWRKLPSGIEAFTSSYAHGKSYLATHGTCEIAKLEVPKDAPPTGHICGLFSYVQGRDARCATPEAWVAELGKLTVGPGPATVSEALVTDLRRDYESAVEQRRRRMAFEVHDADGNLVRRRRVPKPPKRARSFQRLLQDAGFNKRLLGLLDREVERQRAAAEKAAAKAKTDPPTPRRKKCPKTSAARSRSASATTSRPKPGSTPRGRSARSRTKPASVARTRSTATAPARATSSSATRRASAGGSSRPLTRR